MTSGNPRASEIVHLLAHAEQPLTAAQLAKAVAVSERTIKSEIAAARVVAQDAGATLVARRGKGYWLEVVDDARFGTVVEQLDIRAAFRGFGGAAARARTRELVGRMLLADDYLRVDDLAAEMFLSRSALRPDLRGVRTVLAGFGLEIDARPNAGVRVLGSEFARRLCLIHLLESAFHLAVPTLAPGVEPLDAGEAAGLRQDLLAILRDSPVRVADIRTQRMAQYLAFTAVRVRLGRLIVPEPEWEQLVEGLPQLVVARDVMAVAAERTGVRSRPEEVLALAVLLLMWTDVEGRTAELDRYGALGMQAQADVQRIHRELQESMGIDLFAEPTARTTLAAGIVPLLARIRCGLGAAQMSVGTKTLLDSAASPAAFAVARHAASVLADDPPLATDAITDLANRVTVAIDTVRYDFAPRRVALCSGRGLDAAAHLRTEILDQYPPERYFATADTYELYELRGLAADRYDAVVFDGDVITYRYAWPVVFVERPLDAPALKRIHEVVIRPGFRFGQLLDAMGVQTIATFKGLRVRTPESLADVISFRLGSDRASAGVLERTVLRAFETSVFGRLSILVIPRVDPARNQVEIYELDSPLQMAETEITHVVLCAMDFAHDDRALRFFDELTVELVRTPRAVAEAMSAESLGPLTAAVAARAR